MIKNILFIPSSGSSTLLNSLISYWKLDETSGTRVDSAGSNNLTDNNTVGSATGKIGNAASFVAANSEYLSVADNATLDLTTAMTISLWVKPDVIAQQKVIISKFDNFVSGSWALIQWDDELRVHIANSTQSTNISSANRVETSGLGLSSGVWQHIVVVYDGSQSSTSRVKLYLDNVDESSKLSGAWPDATLINSTSPLTVGRVLGLPWFFDGDIDEIGIWGRVLTASERTELYDSGSGVTYPF
jgi:hypothetical protein